LAVHRKNSRMTSDKSERYSQGMKTRRAVLGEAHVDRTEAAKTEFDDPFQDMIVEAAWGHVWSSDGLTPRERSLITLRAARNTGATQDDIREALMHVAIYAGVPAANHAFSLAKAEFSKLEAGRDSNG
jgi:4-carboxymuconolactone decarboxylase